MKNNIVVAGSLYGDEGKSRLVDYIATQATTCVRFNGGCNAGHTVIRGKEKFVFHLIPSGLLNNNVGVITNAVVIDPQKLFQEMDEMRTKGITITPDTLKISYACHITTELHKAQDAYDEEKLGENKIGSTKTGNSPTAVDKYARRGLRMLELIDEAKVRNFYKRNEYEQLAKKYGLEKTYFQFINELIYNGQQLAPYVCDTSLYLDKELKTGGVIFEGAQSVLLDIDQSGNYPFITAGNCVAGFASVSGGFGVKYIDEIVGVVKAFVSQVGTGYLPTRMEEGVEAAFREFAGEYGSTTGRNRKLGWFDLPLLKYSNRINGSTSLAITRMDTLNYFDEIKICDYYLIDGQRHDELPMDRTLLLKAVPHYITLPGWKNIALSHIRSKSELPQNALNYLELIEKTIGTPIKYISVGAERNEIIEV